MQKHHSSRMEQPRVYKIKMDYLFTLMKKYVYNTKCNAKSLSIQGFKNLIRHYYTVENWVVKNDYGTVMGYADKWEMLNCLIEPDIICIYSWIHH